MRIFVCVWLLGCSGNSAVTPDLGGSDLAMPVTPKAKIAYTADVVGFVTRLDGTGSTDAQKLATALGGLQRDSPFGRITWRALDHQSTMGAYVGRLAKKDGRGVMVDWRYADGAGYQPSDAEIRKLRKD